eukprot:3867524-Pyramimonas_sp.AAC.1
MDAVIGNDDLQLVFEEPFDEAGGQTVEGQREHEGLVELGEALHDALLVAEGRVRHDHVAEVVGVEVDVGVHHGASEFAQVIGAFGLGVVERLPHDDVAGRREVLLDVGPHLHRGGVVVVFRQGSDHLHLFDVCYFCSIPKEFSKETAARFT